MGGLDSEKKLGEADARLADQRKRLGDLEAEIELLAEMAGEFDGQTSNPEEEGFIEVLSNEIPEMREKLAEATENCAKIDEQTKATRAKIDDRKKKSGGDLKQEDLDEIAVDIATLEERVEKNEKGVNDLERRVKAKKQRFLDMDVGKKLKRREKEIGELKKHVDEAAKEAAALEKEA